ncbi:MAG: 16S rRNA (guanine(527)-N(7))-methyltransferase RsmG [Propionibacteriales bacterium]|nr:16S rRNA (guanine(527)-N(7))-methyltransferase RsmG [Propionibacteriales bacterium]
MFGESWQLAQTYAELLWTTGVENGLIGPREVPRLWSRHLLNCAAISSGFDPESRVCDVGSGAGLPGVVLALTRPDLELILLEPLLRRYEFLREAVESLGLSRVQVVRGRIEEQASGSFDAVTARAVAPLDRLVRWCLPRCRSGGRLVAMKGAKAEAELEACVPTLRRMDARSWRVRDFTLSTVDVTAVAVEIVAGDTGRA